MEFVCRGNDLTQIPFAALGAAGLSFPDAYADKRQIAFSAKVIREYTGDVICKVPLCTTVEAEAFGAEITLGDDVTGPRVTRYIYDSMEQLSQLRKPDLTKGRIKEVLDAVSILASSKETAALCVEGPFTVICSLVDPMIFYKGLITHRALVRNVLASVEDIIISYSLLGIEQGAAVISYSDPAGTMDIVGPGIFKEFSGPSSLRIIRRICQAAVARRVIIHVCGKMSAALEKLEMIRVIQITAGQANTYGRAISSTLQTITGPTVIGHNCLMRSPLDMRQPVLWRFAE